MEDLTEVKNENGHQTIKGNTISTENICLLISCAVLGVLCDYLFYGKTVGISYPIFILLFYAAFIYNSRGILEFKFNFGWLLSIPVALLSFTYLIFSNRVFGVLNFLGIPMLILAQTTLLTKNNRHEWHKAGFIKDILNSMFCRTFLHIGKPFVLLVELVRRKVGKGRYGVAVKIFTGLFISIPLFLIIIPLLSSADQVFGNYVSHLPDLFKSLNPGEWIVRFIFILSASLIFFSYLWSLLEARAGSAAAEPQDSALKNGLIDPITAATVLLSVNIIYVVFTVIQFTYLFGGVVPQNFTYSEYARRGFFELIAVTLINLCILLLDMYLTKKDRQALSRLIQVFNSLLVACTAVMLLSAFYRMWMYEEAYGYTYLRILTHAFMVFVLAILVITVCRVWSEKVPMLKGYIVTALLAYLIVNYINIDVIIVENNIERYRNTGHIDEYYLGRLSYDAVPLLVQLVNDENLSPAFQNSLYGAKKALNEGRGWQSFNISRYRAKALLDKYDLKYENE
ncbi:MAG: DUF4173 domain-containing protein [Clostridiales bacterium]|nr:DUF4173 domain-containing protein [Eubacteriales bacterium]MDH7565613.1 DUF4173 domain-containing protein [Clostridiales bacterium]